MQIIKSVISLQTLTLFIVLAAASISLSQSNQRIPVTSLLKETGYKYQELGGGVWRIPEYPYNEGTNRKIFELLFQPDATQKYLKVSLHVGMLKKSMRPAEI